MSLVTILLSSPRTSYILHELVCRQTDGAQLALPTVPAQLSPEGPSLSLHALYPQRQRGGANRNTLSNWHPHASTRGQCPK